MPVTGLRGGDGFLVTGAWGAMVAPIISKLDR
jgi:hypothetical protein